MDDERFDRLARNLGRNWSRRDLSIVALLSFTSLDSVFHQRNDISAKGKKKKKKCAAGQVSCSIKQGKKKKAFCVDALGDPANCGTCGNVCPSGQSCQGGACISAAPPLPPPVPPSPPSPPSPPVVTCDAASCSTGCCDGSTCRNGNTVESCGSGGQACDSCTEIEACFNGACVCVAEQNPCGSRICGSVVDRCGTNVPCGNCTTGQTCDTDGTCACTPQSCATCCVGNSCVDTQSDPANCGTCGHTCAESQTCDSGTCVIVVAPGLGNTVQDAVDIAQSGDTILIHPGIYPGDVLIDRDLSIIGSGRSQTTLQGGGAGSVIRIRRDNTVLIQGVTIRGGEADFGRGGGIDNRGFLTVEDSTISDNTADIEGGGIYNEGSLTIRRCTVRDNTADNSGGGIFTAPRNGGAGSLTMEDCILRANGAEYGAGLYNLSAVANLSGSTIVANEANTDGGGFFTNGGTTNFSGCTLRGNLASAFGAGAHCQAGTVTFTGCTIVANGGTTSRGGGIYSRATLNVVQSTIQGNVAAAGGGVFADVSTSTLVGCSVTENRAGQGGGIAVVQGQIALTNTTVNENTATSTNPNLAGGGIYVIPNGTSTVTLNGTSSVTGNSPNNCLNTPACQP